MAYSEAGTAPMPIAAALPVTMFLNPLNDVVVRKYLDSLESRNMSPAVVPTTAVVGIQFLPCASLHGKSPNLLLIGHHIAEQKFP